MNQIRDRHVLRLVQSCSGLDSKDRQDYLNRECQGDEELRRRVEEIVFAKAGSETQTFHNDYERALPGHYRLIEMIGRGGMAEVFLAEDKRLNRSVAIKFLNSEFRKDPERMQRFNQEARAASALNHPNILTIHDIGENEGVQFIVSEYIEGESLSSRIARGRVPLPEAVDIASQIASALAASHRAGIVHRDVKPDNVMIRKDGTVKVLDFGLAKETENKFPNVVDSYANTLARALTSPGLILGTPQYMSPEQARGLHLDHRTDIFSLGVVIFEMVTGRAPFAGDNMADIMAAVLGKEPPRLEELLNDPPLTLIRIVQTALRKEKDDRYGTVEEMMSDLDELRRELVVEPYDGRTTGRTQARTTLQKTIRTTFVGQVTNWKIVMLVIGLPIAVAAAWWLISALRQDARPVQGSMRMVPVTSWSSGTGELVAAASFSPDAQLVAFAATKSGTSTEIWVKPTVGGDMIQVTKSGFYNQYPVWSPNGQEIAFFSSRGSDRGIWRTAFTGGEQSQIASGIGPTARPVYWSKAGKIYFQDGSDLFAVDESSGARTQVTDFGSTGLKPRTIELSGDESTIAYSIKENDSWKVRVMRLGSAAAEEIASTKDQIDYLAWHPNRASVYFSSSVDGAFQIFEGGAGVGEPVQLSNGNLDFLVQDISNDGSRILYGSVNETSDLWSINVEDTEQSLIANDVAAEYWADISPDGKQVVYQSVSQINRPYRGSITIKPVAGPGASAAVAGEGFSPVWSKNGEWLAFFRRSEKGFGIWRVRSTGGESLKLADGAVNAPGYMATPYLKVGVNHIAWSPNSEFLAYSASVDGVSDIWLAAADGSRNFRLTNNKDGSETYSSPTWSADGRYVVFSSDYALRDDPNRRGFRLWRCRSDGAEQAAILESKERFRFLGLNENEQAVFVQKADPDDASQSPKATDVFLLSLKTGAKSKVNTLVNAYFHNIHLSPDTREIAFVSREENASVLWTVPVGGGKPKRLLVEHDPKILISSLVWSPDGRSVIFGRQTRTNLLSMLTK